MRSAPRGDREPAVSVINLPGLRLQFGSSRGECLHTLGIVAPCQRRFAIAYGATRGAPHTFARIPRLGHFHVGVHSFVYYQHYLKDDLVAIDTSRIAASVVTGVGFLGAGAILRTGVNVQGLTTAASLWLVASVGLAAGGGMYLVAVFATSAVEDKAMTLELNVRLPSEQALERMLSHLENRPGVLRFKVERLGI